MRVDIESGKYTYIFEDGRARLLRYGDPTSRDVVGDKLIYCMAAEIAELRQQLAAKDVEIERLKTVPMKYRRMAFNAQLQAENTQLHQQLAAALLWKEAVEHELIVIGIWNKSHETDPKKAVKDVIDWYVLVARDAKQDEVDALMLEYCPSEVSQEQLDSFEARQPQSDWTIYKKRVIELCRRSTK